MYIVPLLNGSDPFSHKNSYTKVLNAFFLIIFRNKLSHVGFWMTVNMYRVHLPTSVCHAKMPLNVSPSIILQCCQRP